MSNHSLLRLMTVRSWPTSATSDIGSSVTAGGASGRRQDSGMAGEGPGQPAGQGRPGSVIRGDGVGLVEATGGGGNPFRKIPAPVVAQGLQAPALKIEVERVAA